jgi:ATP-dependent helicase YprA (DUF1998 family)
MKNDDAQTGMLGIATLIKNIAPLNLMCSMWDIACSYHVRDTFTRKPTNLYYDTVPGGMGLSDKIYEIAQTLLENALEALHECKCEPAALPALVRLEEGACAQNPQKAAEMSNLYAGLKPYPPKRAMRPKRRRESPARSSGSILKLWRSLRLHRATLQSCA